MSKKSYQPQRTADFIPRMAFRKDIRDAVAKLHDLRRMLWLQRIANSSPYFFQFSTGKYGYTRKLTRVFHARCDQYNRTRVRSPQTHGRKSSGHDGSDPTITDVQKSPPYRHLNAISKPTFSLILNWRHKRLCIPRRTLWRYTNVVLLLLFSQLGKVAGRAIYFTDVFSLFFLFFF